MSVLNISTVASTFSFLYGDSGRQMKELYQELKNEPTVRFIDEGYPISKVSM